MLLMSAPAANYSSLPAITMQRTSGSASQASRTAPSSSISSGESALRASGRFRRGDAHRALVISAQDGGHQTIALMPVTARPMISFWICDVPS